MATPFQNFQHHPDYVQQSPIWEKMEDMYLGEDRVKEKAEVYLPKTEVEMKEPQSGRTASRYQQRLDRAVFVNGVDRLTKLAIGHLFRELPIVEDVPPEIESMVRNADLLGTDLTTFLKNASTWSYVMGHCLICVDMPTDDGINSLQDELINKPHPYLIMVMPNEVINWKVSLSASGTYEFDWLVHQISRWDAQNPEDVPDDKVYYKVWTRETWEVWETDPGEGSRILVRSGENPIGIVPFVPVYSQPIRPMVSKPPLLESANLNLAHYRLFSAFNHGLMFHLNPLLTVSGVSDDSEVRIGATSALFLPKDAKAEYAEFRGAGLKIAYDACISLAGEMWESGLRSTTFLGANASGESRRLIRSDFSSWMTSLANLHERSANQIIHLALKWAKIKSDGGKDYVTFSKDFDVTPLEANSSLFLHNLWMDRGISHKTLLKELVRGEVLRKGIDIDKEIDDAKKDEGPIQMDPLNANGDPRRYARRPSVDARDPPQPDSTSKAD